MGNTGSKRRRALDWGGDRRPPARAVGGIFAARVAVGVARVRRGARGKGISLSAWGCACW
eukprot:8606328-Pyramimonas_sp.AAC.1